MFSLFVQIAIAFALVLLPGLLWSAVPVETGQAAIEQRLERNHFTTQALGNQAPQDSPLLLPPVQPAPASASLSQQMRVYVKAFEIEGNRVISGQELSKIAAPYEGREITSSELQALREKISQYYVRSGYINSGAIIPDQKVTDQVIRLQVIEGTLGRVALAGNRWLRARYLRGRVFAGTGEPLNVQRLEQTLRALQQQPLVDQLNAELRPSESLGEADLHIQVKEGRPGRLLLSFNNNRSPSTGGEQLEVAGQWFSLTGHNDPLQVRESRTRGLRDRFGAYSLPINRWDTTVGIYYQETDSKVVEKPFNVLNIQSDARTWGIRVTHPLYRSNAKELVLSLSLERRRSHSSVLNSSFPFPAGGEQGRASVSPIRCSIDWLRRDTERVVALRSQLSVGIDAWDATRHAHQPDGRFLSWQGQAQWVQGLGQHGLQFLLKGSVQFASESLLPMEKFALGGQDSVRGYRENELVRDNGVSASAALRIPVRHLDHQAPRWYLEPFVDYGMAWEKTGPTTAPRSIASVGLSVVWRPSTTFSTSISAAYALDETTPSAAWDLQDDGIHFQVQYQVF